MKIQVLLHFYEAFQAQEAIEVLLGRNPALSVKYTSLARDIEDDKTLNLSVQQIFAGLY